MSENNDANVSGEFIKKAREFLREEYLPKIERCVEKLTDEQVWWRPNEESNSVAILCFTSGNAPKDC